MVWEVCCCALVCCNLAKAGMQAANGGFHNCTICCGLTMINITNPLKTTLITQEVMPSEHLVIV